MHITIQGGKVEEFQKLGVEAMRILSVDCSTNSMAFALFEESKLVRWGEITFGKGDMYHRMNNANRVVNRMVDNGYFDDIDLVAFEGAIFMNSRKTVIDLSYAFGSAMAPLFAPGVRVESVPAIVWQKGTGNPPLTKAEKEELQKRHPGKSKSWYSNKGREFRKERSKDNVRRIYGVEVPNDNVSDAIMLGTYIAEKVIKSGN